MDTTIPWLNEARKQQKMLRRQGLKALEIICDRP